MPSRPPSHSASSGTSDREVGAERGGIRLGTSRARGQQQSSRSGGRGLQQTAPQLRPRQVHRGDGRPPPQQRTQRTHLGAGPEDGDDVPVEPEPLRVVEHCVHGVASGRLHDPVPDPGVEAAAQLVAPKPVDRGRAARARSPVPPYPESRRSRTRVGPIGLPLGQRPLALGGDDPHPVVDRGQTGVRRGFTASCLEPSPASSSRRKWVRYPLRQLVSCCAARAPAGSTGRSASAATARPRSDVLRLPATLGKATPGGSVELIAASCRVRGRRGSARTIASASSTDPVTSVIGCSTP